MSDSISRAHSLLDVDRGDVNLHVTQLRWQGDPGQRIAGRLVATRRIPHPLGGESVLCLLLDTDRGRVSCLAYAYPERLIKEARNGHGAEPGDVIAIERGGLIEREDGSSFRDWSVVVLPHDEHAEDGEVQA